MPAGPVAFSATRTSRASQQISTCARMRDSNRWNSGRSMGSTSCPGTRVGFEEILVAQGDLGRGQARVGGGQQVLTVQLLLGDHPRPVDIQPSGAGLAKPSAEGEVVTQSAPGSGVSGHSASRRARAVALVVVFFAVVAFARAAAIRSRSACRRVSASSWVALSRGADGGDTHIQRG
jgi:hypothetical protein